MKKTNATEDFIIFIQTTASLIHTEDGDFRFAHNKLMNIYKNRCRGVLFLPTIVDDVQIILT